MIIETISQQVLAIIDGLGYWGALLFSVLDRVTISLIPSEILLPAYGVLAQQGVFLFWPLFWTISFGSLIGEIIIFWLSRLVGRSFLDRYGKYFLVYRHDLDHLDRLFIKHGSKFVFWGRFLPVGRAIVAIPAGISGLRIDKFIVYSFLGMLPYNFLLIYLGSKLGQKLELLNYYYNITEKIILITLGVAVVWYIWRHLKKKHTTHQ